jgi:hypothetical protein
VVLLRKEIWVIYLPIAVLTVFLIVLYSPEITFLLSGNQLFSFGLQSGDKMNLFLTLAISMFAAVEGYSTYLNLVLEDKRNKIEDARNELEKAYGPLYSLLNTNILEEKQAIELLDEDKKSLDQVIATYPFMFPSKIYDIWRNKIQKMQASGMQTISLGTITNDRPDFKKVRYYKIPIEFGKRLNKEYDLRVRRYNELIKK